MTEVRDVDVAVIGGGLAGLSAALEAARLGLRTINWCGPAPGGLLLSIESVQGLPDHPEGIAGYDLGPMTQEAALEAGADCRSTQAVSIARRAPRWQVVGDDGAALAHAVILAPGSSVRHLGIPGEDDLAGKGVSHCASCDAPLLRGRVAVVVGGGDAACQEALTVAAHAERVHLLVRGASLRAHPAWRDRVAAQSRIAVQFDTRVVAIEGDTVVTGVRLDDGRTLAADAVFIYPGLQPNTRWLEGLVPQGPDGHLIVDADLSTPVQGLFAAGCCRAGSSGQAAQALSDGITAARSAHRWVATCSTQETP